MEAVLSTDGFGNQPLLAANLDLHVNRPNFPFASNALSASLRPKTLTTTKWKPSTGPVNKHTHGELLAFSTTQHIKCSQLAAPGFLNDGGIAFINHWLK